MNDPTIKRKSTMHAEIQADLQREAEAVRESLKEREMQLSREVSRLGGELAEIHKRMANPNPPGEMNKRLKERVRVWRQQQALPV